LVTSNSYHASVVPTTVTEPSAVAPAAGLLFQVTAVSDQATSATG
jgi:hypothetical protein